MRITNVEIRLANEWDYHENLLAYAAITIDEMFVVNQMRIIRGPNGRLFVAMPQRTLTAKCRHCGRKDPIRARFCTECGRRLDFRAAPRDDSGRSIFHADTAHPITGEGRAIIEDAVLAAYAYKAGKAAPLSRRLKERLESIDAA